MVLDDENEAFEVVHSSESDIIRTANCKYLPFISYVHRMKKRSDLKERRESPTMNYGAALQREVFVQAETISGLNFSLRSLMVTRTS